ncbi:DUF4861 family protein, partial [Marinilabiliaceae bacterium ANBcel2]|nr:DUF4861 family protein [Marinilabiliaceae bacterium ANBcel2]
VEVIDRPIILERNVVEHFLLGDIIGDFDVLVTDNNGEIMASQTDDMNGDGQWDELVFLADFNGKESKSFSFEVVAPSDIPEFTKRTNIRFARRNPPYEPVRDDLRLQSTDSPTISALYQMEGPGWENDIVGFRNYYDARNGIDIFGKTTSEMVLDIAGIDGQNYHEMDEWGMDNLAVGNSLGAGAIAIGIDDNIYRVGPADKAGFDLISEGPVRSVFDLTFEGVPAGDRKYDLVHRIFIYAGEHIYRAQVFVDDLYGDEVLFTGIVDMHDLPIEKSRSLDYKVFGTHGNQGYDGEILGLGLLIPQDQFIHQASAPDSGEGIVQTHLIALELNENSPTEFAFFSGWDFQDSGFSSFDYFFNKLEKAAYKLDNKAWMLPN